MNTYITTGRLCFDPDKNDLGCKIKLAIYLGKDKESLFLKVFVFGDAAKNVLEHKKKGDKILVQGRLDLSKSTGEVIVMSNHVEFL